MGDTEIRYLKSLAKQYPTIAAAATEIINLKAILSLPKGTEHFITDVHGEYEQFQHIMRNGSGAIKRKIEQEFGTTFSRADKKNMAALIYYPEMKLEEVASITSTNLNTVKSRLRRALQRLKLDMEVVGCNE